MLGLLFAAWWSGGCGWVLDVGFVVWWRNEEEKRNEERKKKKVKIK
jgi:hypothetical protein